MTTPTPLPPFNRGLTVAAEAILARGYPCYDASKATHWAFKKVESEDACFFRQRVNFDPALCPPGSVFVQKDGLKTPMFQITSLDNLIFALRNKTRQERIQKDLASLYWYTEKGVQTKLFCDLEDRFKKNIKRDDFRHRVASILTKLRALLPSAILAVHFSEEGHAGKLSCHIHAVKGPHANINVWHSFVLTRLLPMLTPEENDIFDPAPFKVGAFRMVGCSKINQNRFLIETPDAELSDQEASALHASHELEYMLRLHPHVMFDGDTPLEYTADTNTPQQPHKTLKRHLDHNNSNTNNNNHKTAITKRVKLEDDNNQTQTQEQNQEQQHFKDAALAWISSTYEVSSVKPGHLNTFYVGLAKTEAARTCPFAGRVHASNTISFVIDLDVQQVVSFCHKGCLNADKKRSLRYELVDSAWVPAGSRVRKDIELRWVFEKTAVQLTSETLYQPFGEYQFHPDGFLTQGARILGNYHIDAINASEAPSVLQNQQLPQHQPTTQQYCEERMRFLTKEAFERYDTLCIKAGYGLGKSFCVLRQMCPQKQFFPPNTYKVGEHFVHPLLPGKRDSYVVVTHRKTLAYQLYKNLKSLGQKDCVLYTAPGNHAHARKMVVQLDSIAKAAHITTPDLLILDECESLVHHLSSATLAKRGAWVYSHFEAMVRSARKVIALDADLGPRSLDWLKMLRKDVVCYHNTFRKYTDHKVKLIDDKALWLDKLLVTLAAGKNVAVPCTSKSTALALFSRVRELGYTAAVYTGDTGDAVKAEAFADVNVAWSSYQFVAWTSCCEAGVSFDIEHFHAVFAAAEVGGPSPRAFIQMLHRVRRVASKTIYLFVDDPARHQLTAPDTCLNTLERLIRMPEILKAQTAASIQSTTAPNTLAWSDIQAPFAVLVKHNEAEALEATTCFMYHVVAILKNQGYAFAFSKRQQVPKENVVRLHQVQGALKAERIQKLVRAPDICSETFERLKARKQHTEAEALMLERFLIRAAFRYSGAIDGEWLETYDMRKTAKHFKRLCEIFPGTSGSTEFEKVDRLREDAELAAGWNFTNAFESVKDKRRSNAWVHMLTHEVLRLLGFAHGVFGPADGSANTVERSVVEAGVDSFKAWFTQDLHGVSVRQFIDHLLGIRCKTTEWDFELLLRYANCILNAAYGVSVKCVVKGGRGSATAGFCIAGLALWNMNAADVVASRPSLH
jgi:hypothetical protein